MGIGDMTTDIMCRLSVICNVSVLLQNAEATTTKSNAMLSFLPGMFDDEIRKGSPLAGGIKLG